MAKRESKKSVSLTDPKPNADAAGPSSMNYKAKKRSTIKWFIAGALLLLMIFLGGGLLFLDHFPALRQFTLVEFFEQSFAKISGRFIFFSYQNARYHPHMKLYERQI